VSLFVGGGGGARTKFIRKFQDPYSSSGGVEKRDSGMSLLVMWNVSFFLASSFQMI
jgi:hypothetical protein